MSETNTPSASDAELISQVQSGNMEAFGELYARYLDPIYRYIQTRVDEAADAEDLCEVVFLRTFEALDRYEERGHPFSAYLYQVARNQLADHYRTQDVRVALEQVAEPISDELDPEDAYALQERVLDVINSLGNLREDYQEVIRLRVVLELPTATTAMWMDRSPGAIRVLLHRALVALREDVDG